MDNRLGYTITSDHMEHGKKSSNDSLHSRVWPQAVPPNTVGEPVHKMHINPHFAGTVRPHINIHFRSPEKPIITAPHINPHFHSFPGKTFSQVVNPSHHTNIHINPKLLANVTQASSYSDPKPTAMCADVYQMPESSKFISSAPPHVSNKYNTTTSKNRYKLVRSHTPSLKPVSQENKTLTPKQERKCVKIGKYKIVSIGKTQSVFAAKPKPKAAVSSSHNRVWKKSGTSCITSSKYKLLRNNKASPNKTLNIINRSLLSKKPVPNLKKVVKFCPNVVYVNGCKFVVHNNVLSMASSVRNNNYKTSKALDAKCQKVCIGGVVYIRKSKTLFVKEIVKTKITKKLKKINLPCPIFRRLGVCARSEQGKCSLLHDQKHVNICRKFLSGSCDMSNCKLSHNISLEKMPTCNFYLNGCCTRQKCPYLHVKISTKAQVCTEFIRGYCAKGKDCNQRHVNICPTYDKYGKCDVSKCPYPHKKDCNTKPITTVKTKIVGEPQKSLKNNTVNVVEKDEKQKQLSEVENKNTRYFDNEIAVLELESNNDSRVVTEKPKCEKLPAYISIK